MTDLVAREFSLTDRYGDHDAELYLTGLQALVRVPLEQSRRDAAAGHNVGILISGYEGSPLAGYDIELGRQSALLAEHRIVFRPGVNEELAANAVQGSQLASASQDKTVDGVVGIWYGKAPGLDRATDALRHANIGGADPQGGALVLVGDDSIAKSSTVPSSSEVAMAELGLAVLVPADPQEILDFGLHGIELSRFSGLWVGMKLSTNVVDGSATVRVTSGSDGVILPSRQIAGADYVHEVSSHFMQPNLGKLEESLQRERRELALRYIRANKLNRVWGDPDATVGIVTAGIAFRDTLEALERLGITRDKLEGAGIRILKLGAISPIDPEAVRSFAEGLEEVIVIEEKRAFLELAVKDSLYALRNRPAVVGRTDEAGADLLRAHADLPPEYLASVLRARLEKAFDADRVAALRAGIPRQTSPIRIDLPLLARTPYFCSGCPHNRSTVVPDGSVVGGGIGCHAIATLMPSDRVGEIISLSQMGGEGAPWIGMEPFVKHDHLFQNLGDGTFHHSGSLAIRAAVAAGVNITYKLLYNDAVAMTGGQGAVGKMSVPMIVQELLAEGVQRIVITTEDTRRYRRVDLPRGVRVLDRSKLVPVQEELAQVPGVTVLIHDQECATELRRKRKRGKAEDPKVRAFINERVCEGCGDCGQKSNCVSVQPVDTAFGRKTEIDQASCNKDYSCLDGDCPSFVKVVPGKKRRPKRSSTATHLPEPTPVIDDAAINIRITGVGGTGIVTASQILATAATLAGYHVRGLDQLGLAQKGGAVVSDLRLSANPIEGSNKIAAGDCDLYLGCDMLVAATEKNLEAAAPDRTVAVVSTTRVPTGAMILDPSMVFPEVDEVKTLIGASSRADVSVYADARVLAHRELGSEQFANMVLVGIAYQSGALPLAFRYLEEAVTMNGVAVEANLRALAVGREHVARDGSARVGPASSDETPLAPSLRNAVQAVTGLPPATIARLERLVAELSVYQNEQYAMRLVRLVEQVASAENLLAGGPAPLTDAALESMFKLMAYKDEYEVARLYLEPEFRARLTSEFGESARFSYQLHPPVLRALGMDRKISLGPWFTPVFRVLKAARRLRGSKLDLFGYAEVRRVERQLVDDYEQLCADVIAALDSTNAELAAQILAHAQEVRGYESIKLRSVEQYRERVRSDLERLGR